MVLLIHLPAERHRWLEGEWAQLIGAQQVLAEVLGVEQRQADRAGVGIKVLEQVDEQVAGPPGWVVVVVEVAVTSADDVFECRDPLVGDREREVVTVAQAAVPDAGFAPFVDARREQLGEEVDVAGVPEPEIGVRVDVGDVERRASAPASIASRQRKNSSP